MFPTFLSLSYSRLPVISFNLILFLLICFSLTQASSPALQPLKRVEEPTVSLQHYPRTQQLWRRSIDGSLPTSHSNSLRLTVSAYGENYILHLRPNDDELIHPAARINYFKADDNGQVALDRTEPLIKSRVKAYSGDVMHPDHSDARMQEDLAGGLVDSKYPPLGWARIMIYDKGNPRLGISPKLEGAFTVGGISYHMMSRDKYMRLKLPHDPALDTTDHSLVIFRDSDVITTNEAHRDGLSPDAQASPNNHDSHSCSHDTLGWNRNPSENPVYRQPKAPTWLDKLAYGSSWENVNPNMSIWRRDDIVGNNGDSNFETHIGQTAGCPVDPVVIYMGVAADCTYVQKYGSQENATEAILNDWNMASALYKKTFNINLAIVQLNIHDTTCPPTPDPAFPWNVDCSSGVELNDRLSLFSQWRGTQDDQAGLWHLMSGCPTGTEIGVAWLGTLCQTTTTGSTGSFVSGTAVTTAGRQEWQVVAHEIGHNFGAIHDCVSGCDSTTSCCPLSTSQCNSNSQFIMSPTSLPNEVSFSPCSIGNICSLMQSKTTNTTCLVPPSSAVRTISLQQCGNGIVEGDEECDPGIGNNSTCCDQQTCKFTTGSVCDPSNGACCTSQCQFAPSTQVCRAALDPKCDFAETCTGSSAQCPWDKTQPNGLSCGSDGLACASGQCTSLSLQCQTVGASLNLQTACPNKGDTSCQVSCLTPGDPTECTVLQAQLLDGSPCGYGGSCSNGSCVSGGLLDTVKSWYRQNLQIAIPITILGSILVISILWVVIRCMLRRDCCCRRKYPKILVGAPVGSPLRPYMNTPPSQQSLLQQPQSQSPSPPPLIRTPQYLEITQRQSLEGTERQNQPPQIQLLWQQDWPQQSGLLQPQPQLPIRFDVASDSNKYLDGRSAYRNSIDSTDTASVIRPQGPQMAVKYAMSRPVALKRESFIAGQSLYPSIIESNEE